jgi:hypothetical protein
MQEMGHKWRRMQAGAANECDASCMQGFINLQQPVAAAVGERARQLAE